MAPDELAALLNTIHPRLAAAIGHAMAYAAEDDDIDPLFVDRELAEAACVFYPTANNLADLHPNVDTYDRSWHIEVDPRLPATAAIVDDDGEPPGDDWIAAAYEAQHTKPPAPHYDGGRLVHPPT